jgi:hypothetical protein
MVIASTAATSTLSVTESATPKPVAFTSAGVQVSPQTSLVPPYVCTVSTVGHIVALARSVVWTAPPFTRRTRESTIVPSPAWRSMFTSMPSMIAAAGTCRLKLVASR